MLVALPSAINKSKIELLGNKTELDNFFNMLGQCIDELKIAYHSLMQNFANKIIKELGINATYKQSLKILAERANAIPKEVSDLRLARFTDALKISEKDKDWIESICSLASNKPLRDWNDNDVERCDYEISQLIIRFLNAETSTIVQHDSGKKISKLVKELRVELNKSSLEIRQKRAALMLLMNEINGDKR